METNLETKIETETPQTTPEASAQPNVVEKETDPGVTIDPAAVTPPPVEFKPDFKLKVMDEEKEIPEAFRALMKDEKSAKEVKEVFEKYYGHDFTKPKYETLKSTHSELQKTYQQVESQINDLKSDFQRGDLDSFFSKLNIPKETILQYALQKVQYEQLPPDQKQLMDDKQTAERERILLQRQNQQLSQTFESQMQQARRMALDTELARSDIKSAADVFDARVGKPGAFRQEIINRGQLAWTQRNVDLSPGQAVEEVMRIFGLQGAPASASPQNQPAPASAAVPPQAPTIPNVGGAKATSPVRQKPRSIEDLKKMAAEM